MQKNFVFRPIHPNDVDQLERLVAYMGAGNGSSFHTNRTGLDQRVAESRRSFATSGQQPGYDVYLFVMEDLMTRHIVGLSKVHARANYGSPFYSYELRRAVHASDRLEVRNEVPTLHLVEEYTGASELCSSFLHPDYRGKRLSPLLTLGRLMFVVDYPLRFAPRIIGEMRGVYDTNDRSPFWNHVFKYFFRELDYPAYTRLLAEGLESEILRLLPRGPLYLPLLPDAVQEVVGKVHPQAQSQVKLITREGFLYRHHIAYSSGAPIFEAQRSQLRIARRSRSWIVGSILPSLEAPWSLMSNMRLDYRAVLGPLLAHPDGTVSLLRQTAEALCVVVGDRIRCAQL